jgi:hypothetical protein
LSIASKRSLSHASDAFEISSRRKISLFEYSEWVTRCRICLTSAWKERVCLSIEVVRLRFAQGGRAGVARRRGVGRWRRARAVSSADPRIGRGQALSCCSSGAKLGKLFASGGTMLISLVVYAFVFGWRYAAGFVALLFAHEMGHFLAARRRGLAVGMPTFIPFVGAWIDLKEQPRDVETEAYVALAGPVVGTVAAILVYLAAADTGRAG